MTRDLRLNAALVLSGLALFVALGGDSLAAKAISALKKNSVTSKAIKNGTIATKDLNAKTVTALRGQTGAAGAKGDKGDPGPKGDKGDPGPAGTATVADGSITTEKLATGAVTSAKLGADAVDTQAVQDGSLTEADLGDNSVGFDELKPVSVGNVQIQLDAVGSPEVKDDALTLADLKGVDLSLHITQAASTIPTGSCTAKELPAPGAVPGQALTLTPTTVFPSGMIVLSRGVVALSGAPYVALSLCNFSGSGSNPAVDGTVRAVTFG